jgi:putative (di)nucleoside polyphosphate hydrolase
MAKSQFMEIDGKVYRKNAGIVLYNKAGLVLYCRRRKLKNELYVGHDWQFPQGGIDEGEDVKTAALRELCEETGVHSVGRVHEDGEWLAYDFPFVYERDGVILAGQAQKWLLVEFAGKDGEIAIPSEEFIEYRWTEPSMDIAAAVASFKAEVYSKMLAKFIPLIGKLIKK